MWGEQRDNRNTLDARKLSDVDYRYNIFLVFIFCTTVNHDIVSQIFPDKDCEEYYGRILRNLISTPTDPAESDALEE